MNRRKPTINFILLNKAWTKLAPSWEADVSRALNKTAERLKKDFSELEVSIVLSDDRDVKKLNKTFRHKDASTNVLSFPSEEEGELGDIILAYETVLREANEKGISPLIHMLHLIIHGFLHLLGYDHKEENDAYQMETLEIQILKSLNISNPYEDI